MKNNLSLRAFPSKRRASQLRLALKNKKKKFFKLSKIFQRNFKCQKKSKSMLKLFEGKAHFRFFTNFTILIPLVTSDKRT